MRKVLKFIALGLLFAPFSAAAMSYGYPTTYYTPQTSWCGSYYGTCLVGTQHTFAPYTNVTIDPFTYTNVGTYQYPTQTYTYPSQQTYAYSYPQYQSSYYQPTYYQPTYQQQNYQSYGYSSYPTYTPYYMLGDEYCYSGYGCYPFYVEDPHQWIYDSWTGTWY